MTPYLYTLKEDYYRPLDFTYSGTFKSQYLTIEDNVAMMPKGYSWNGCSPCVSVLGLFTLNTPNGHLHHGYPITYWASCLHDALFQYRGHHDIDRYTTNILFLQDLEANQFKLAKLYYNVVDKLSPRDHWETI